VTTRLEGTVWRQKRPQLEGDDVLPYFYSSSFADIPTQIMVSTKSVVPPKADM
jgi:hypothetical protein